MRAVHGSGEPYEEYEYLYGKRLLEEKDPVLRTYLLREQGIRESILEQLRRHKNSPTAREREKEVQEEWRKIRQALATLSKHNRRLQMKCREIIENIEKILSQKLCDGMGQRRTSGPGVMKKK